MEGLTTKDRGYGREHRKLRARWAPVVAAGEAVCARCGGQIERGESWDLGHDDVDRSLYSGPEHQRCNRRAGGKKAARSTSLKRRARIWSRNWLSE